MSSFDFKASLLASAVRKHVSLRPYQIKAEQGVYLEWDVGHKNVLAVIPTGGGKTRLIASIVSKHTGGACIFAHRKELVAQLAGTLNEFGIPFRLICDPKDRKAIIAGILRKQKVCYHDMNAAVSVASVGTLYRIPTGKQAAQYRQYLSTVTLWVCDEAHHLQGEDGGQGNQWGKAAQIFTHPDLRGLGVTATPARSDGGGLSRDTDGLFDAMVMGPTLQDLFDDGYLCPYKKYSVPCRVDYDNVTVGASGEFVQAKLVAAEEADDELVGDIVEKYLLYAAGLKGICFVSSVSKAEETARRFNEAGVPALALSGETDDVIRDAAKEDLESGKLQMLVNCNLYGEGNDLPAVEVVILGTGTASLPRFMQWVGRLYRLFLHGWQWAGYDEITAAERRQRIAESPKPFGVLIDHGSNIVRFNGPPEAPHRTWQLGRASRKSVAGETVPYRVCANPGLRLTNPDGHTWESFRAAGWANQQMLHAGHLEDTGLPCAQPYERVFKACPYCGFFPEPITRTDPEHVDGDLELLTEETLAELYASVRKNVPTIAEYQEWLVQKRVPALGYARNIKLHREHLAEILHLKWAMGLWGGWRKQQGDNDSQMQRRFFHLFGLDVITAQGLPRAEAEALRLKIIGRLTLDEVSMPEYDPGVN
ncbi:excinuclease ABC subunit B [compost metagenome]